MLFRSVREQVVGQAYRGYQIGLTEQLVTHGGLGASLLYTSYVGMALHREGNRMLEDVRLDELSVFHPFQRKDVAPARIDVYKRQLRHSPNADVMAFEKDLLTGTILRHLYPDQKMRTCGFEMCIRDRCNPVSATESKIKSKVSTKKKKT